MKRMRKVNVIKKLVKYGLITLVGFSLFVGCEDREYYEEELCYNISFQVGLPYAWYKIQSGDVIDMEAYALAKVCRSYGIPFVSFKYITDGADGDAGIDWEQNVSKGIVKFKQKILSLVK